MQPFYAPEMQRLFLDFCPSHSRNLTNLSLSPNPSPSPNRWSCWIPPCWERESTLESKESALRELGYTNRGENVPIEIRPCHSPSPRQSALLLHHLHSTEAQQALDVILTSTGRLSVTPMLEKKRTLSWTSLGATDVGAGAFDFSCKAKGRH